MTIRHEKALRRMSALLLIDIGQLLTLRSAAASPRRGAFLSELGIMRDAAVSAWAERLFLPGSTKEALRDPG